MSDEKTIKIPFKDGKMVDAVEVGFAVVKEEWNEYKLEDGTIIRFKSVVTQIARTKEYNENNEPIYVIKSKNIASTKIMDDKLMKKGS